MNETEAIEIVREAKQTINTLDKRLDKCKNLLLQIKLHLENKRDNGKGLDVVETRMLIRIDELL